jgi:hypothetical protein
MNQEDTPIQSSMPTPTGDSICADRACARCGFNLIGQQVLREGHYNMIVVRCPECGTMAALEEYPILSKWAGRWARLFAALWILLLLGYAAGTTGSIYGLGFGSVAVASDQMSVILSQEYGEWIDDGQGGSQAQQYTMRWTTMDQGWIENEFPRVLRSSGGIFSQIDWDVVWVWLGMGLVLYFWGVFWSVVLLGARRRSAWVVILALSALAVYFDYIAIQSGNFTNSIELAQRTMFSTVMAITLVVMAACSGAGVFTGRKLARLVVCLALPPRMRVPLGILWTRDGLELPKPILK